MKISPLDLLLRAQPRPSSPSLRLYSPEGLVVNGGLQFSKSQKMLTAGSLSSLLLLVGRRRSSRSRAHESARREDRSFSHASSFSSWASRVMRVLPDVAMRGRVLSNRSEKKGKENSWLVAKGRGDLTR